MRGANRFGRWAERRRIFKIGLASVFGALALIGPGFHNLHAALAIGPFSIAHRDQLLGRNAVLN